MQGFGNVGSVSAELLGRGRREDRRGTDWKGGVHNPAGLDIPTLLAYVTAPARSTAFPGGEPLTNERLFELDGDILFPAALENQITPENARRIKAKIDRRGRQRADHARRRQHLSSAACSSCPTSSPTPAG